MATWGSAGDPHLLLEEAPLGKVLELVRNATAVSDVGAKVKPDPYDFERLVGGTLELTRVGQWWLTE